MEIVIVGGGKLGQTLCNDLSNEGHEIVLIDQKQGRIDMLEETYDIRGVNGNGAAIETQKEANVSLADVFIAATPSDDTNLIAASIANKLGAKFTIARVRNPEYARDLGFYQKQLGIGMLINPDAEAAADITRVFDYPAANAIEPFANGLVDMVQLRVSPNAPIVGQSLADIRKVIPELLLCIIDRETGITIPKGSTQLQENDYIQMVGNPKAIHKFSQLCGHKNARWRSALIVGGSRIAYYLIPALLKRGVYVKVIETKPEVADRLAMSFPEAEIIYGDGTDQKFLREMHLSNYDVAVALINIDEENLMFSLFAHQQGVGKTITKVNRRELIKLIDHTVLDTIITPSLSSSDRIIQYIRSHEKTASSKLETYARLGVEGVEALEFIATEDSQVCLEKIQNLNIKQGVLIAHILRGTKRIIPAGADQIQPGDRVLLVALDHRINQLDDIIDPEANR